MLCLPNILCPSREGRKKRHMRIECDGFERNKNLIPGKLSKQTRLFNPRVYFCHVLSGFIARERTSIALVSLPNRKPSHCSDYSFTLILKDTSLPKRTSIFVSLVSLPVCQFQRLDSFNLTTVCFAVMGSHRSIVHSQDYAKPTTLLKVWDL